MGNLNSLLNSAKGVDNVPEVEVGGGGDEFMSTPVPGGTKDKLKSKPFMALLDPRSPTVGVSRTPVEVSCGSVVHHRLCNLNVSSK